MTNTDLSMQQYISLAAIMLLAPVIPTAVRNNEIILSAEESAFVESYIHYGNYILAILIGSGILRAIETFIRKSIIVNYISQSLSILAIVMIFLGMYAIVRNRSIMQGNHINYKAILSLFRRAQ